MLKKLTFSVLIVAATFWVSCTDDSKQNNGKEDVKDPGPKEQADPIPIAEFNEDSAYKYIEKQVSFGPRVPGTPAHAYTGQWLIEKLKSFCDTVYVQDAELYGQPIRNIIGSFKPSEKNRIALAAHWDTRPMADQDLERPTEPADGANDGASGVGVLLEVARQLQITNSKLGVDIIFFDAEDGGTREGKMESWCIGSQYWSVTKHVRDYNARFGILLDMVGAKDATFPLEGTSAMRAGNVLSKVWRTAQNMGYGNLFLNVEGSDIIDDHRFMNDGGIPTIDIIHYDYIGGRGFGDYWHTHNDNMDIIYKPTLRKVGMTVLQVVYNER